MKLGLALRVMGESSQAGTLLECAQAADQAGIDDLWVQDHIAIPPDDSEGSGGRYLDPLATLAWLAGATNRIGLGTGVLVAPYRRPLPTAKSVATIQELSGGRVLLGVGVGWMGSEFRALGLDRGQRGAETDRFLELFNRCFRGETNVVEENGQSFLFEPRPPAPPLFIGGSAPHALARAARYRAGWMPMSADPRGLGPEIARLAELSEAAGHPRPEVAVLGGLPPGAGQDGADLLAALAEIGVTRFVAGGRYTTAREFRTLIEGLNQARPRTD
ncbi:MAG: TIGR03619 family F420-dependent LLM class oxidoreductase [Myxococcota bacterium]|jgi:probable F420-dependent oxidoreductase|nr:TIGR03619 family F420-dependent LLM class oxidoreductase [Myxococcota bacterium]